MGVMLDTSVLIAAERGALNIVALLESVPNEPIAISAITASELLHGCHRATDNAIRMRRAAFVESLLEAIPILTFGLLEARRHAELWADLAQAGQMIGPHDMLIGATALAQGYRVASLNPKDFRRIPGLQLVNLEAFRT